MKRIVRGVCGLLSAVMLLSTTAMAPAYTPVVTSDERVKGFYNVYNGENASLQMELAGRYNSGAMSEEGGSLEIVQFNARNGFAYAVSGLKGTLIAIDLNGGMDGEKVTALGGTEYDVKSMVRSYGDMTSVAISPDGTHLAVAIQAVDYDEQGSVALFTCQANGSLTHLSTVEVGVQPDMVTFTPEGSKILTANEGEPRMGYSAAGAVDPKGSVSIIDAETFNVETVGFDNFDGRRDALVKEGIVLKKNTVPSVDLEPEYIACTDDTAYVSCQEANAIAVLDLDNAQFTGIYSVGFEDYSKVAIDIDKKDETYAPKAYESLRGIRMPDGISLYEAGGKTYLLTANEGDSREWDKYLNEDERNFKKGENTSPSGAITADNSGLKGKVIFFDSADYDGLDSSKDYLFGGRSFTVLKVTENGLEEIFDSGSKFESITDEKISANFNCSNDDKTVDDRSGKKGPEPESVTVGTVGGKTYAFIALERIGGVMVYDITNPDKTEFVNYINSREFDADIRGDVSPEGLCFIPAAQSKTGKPLLLAACEVSGTLAVYELTGEQEKTPDIPAPVVPSAPGIDPILAAILAAANQQRFEDVASNAYCYDAVNWAVERNIASGTGKYTFSPDRICTRADFVTFLWRAAGKPVVNYAMNFSDVKESSYYAEAVRWAASLGIVTGLSKNTFGAANAVTREQAVTMLWRFAKQQGFDTTQGGMAIREFDDYDSLSEYAREAMAWAVNAGILKGSGNRLMPDADCTRAQLVTLLYRLESQTR